ncbi:MAG: hypothetical protein ABR595_10295 [Psychroflexus sp.]
MIVSISFAANSKTSEITLGGINCDHLAEQTFRTHYQMGEGLSWDNSMKVAEASHSNCMDDDNGHGSDWSKVKATIKKHN